jgi:N-hydroxyarylamine O-acetyltransferase
MLDLDAYLDRIGLAGRPSLHEVHSAHATRIPFENLDPQRGVPVSLDVDDLQRKLVTQRRGGYCFEHNLLLKAGLDALGYEVETVLARVRRGGVPGVGAVRPRSHLVLRVKADGTTWHADVGFGAGNPQEPLPWGPSGEHERAGWIFRVVEDGPELVLQTPAGDGWEDMYGFVPEPAPHVDLEVSNWFTSTHPRSPFVAGLLIGAQSPDGSRMRLTDWEGLALTEESPGDSRTTPVQREDLPELLAQRFGLSGFALDGDGKLVPAGQAA